MENGINIKALENMTIGEIQQLEKDYPHLIDLKQYLKSREQDNLIDEIERKLVNPRTNSLDVEFIARGFVVGSVKQPSAQEIIDSI